MTRVRIFPNDRTSGLGASELGAIGGLSPWRTPLDIWLSKIEGITSEPTTSQEFGLAIEGFLVKRIEGAKRNSVTKSHAEWPVVRLFATPDGIADRGRTLVEAKSVTSRFADWADGAIPEYYRLQAAGQLACYPDAHKVMFSVLMGGRHELRVQERDELAEAQLIESAMRWWANYIVREIVPPPLTEGDRWTIARRDSMGDRMTRLATGDEEAAAGDLLALRERIGELEAEADATRLRLAELASEADIAGAGWKATWSTRIQRDYRAAWISDKGTAVLPDDHVLESRVFTVRSVLQRAAPDVKETQS
jgi:predicted phage-related endonuclease